MHFYSPFRGTHQNGYIQKLKQDVLENPRSKWAQVLLSTCWTRLLIGGCKQEKIEAGKSVDVNYIGKIVKKRC